MAISIRALIEEAYYRAGIVPGRGMKPRGDQMESGLELLKGIVKRYNNDNYLACLQNEYIIKSPALVNHIFNGKDDLCMPENTVIVDTFANLPPASDYADVYDDMYGFCEDQKDSLYKIRLQNDTYIWYGFPITTVDYRIQQAYRYMEMKQIVLPNVEKILSVMFTSSNNDLWYKLAFLPYSEFDNAARTANVFTYMQRGDNEWVVKIKPFLAKQNIDLKLVYNESLEIDLNKDLYIPDAYIELLIVALTHKLALVHPRLDDAQMNRLTADLESMQRNVLTPKAEAKMIIRDAAYDYDRSYQGILHGTFLGI